ncbi:MAG: hypothetical protein ACYCSN_05920 [Acidobacteriaceae bacterium]
MMIHGFSHVYTSATVVVFTIIFTQMGDSTANAKEPGSIAR